METLSNRTAFAKGFRDGIPIGLGYFAVSFSLGIIAKKSGIAFYQGFLASFLNHASAGEYALYTAIGALASYIEVALVTFVANARYLLLSSALSQKFDESTSLVHRIGCGFCVTDEIFAISVSLPVKLNPFYIYGAFLCAVPLWSMGTAIGILVGSILPDMIVAALSVSLYGMFLAIIIPPAKKSLTIAICVAASFALSYVFPYIPLCKNISSGNKIIILTLLIAGLAALIKPVNDDEGAESGK